MENPDSANSFITENIEIKKSGLDLARNRIPNQRVCVLFIISVIGLFACHKSTLDTGGGNGDWRLVNKFMSIGSSSSELIPSKDSAVLLELDSNGLYFSRLNNKIVSQGSYSIAVDTSVFSYGDTILQFNNFQTTGIFNLFTLEKIGINGRVISSFDGFYMTISHDSLTLSSAFTPGGYLSYLFVKN